MAVVPRLFIDAALGKGAEIALEKDQAHYLVNVMRRKDGDPVRVFNGKDGEWRAEVAQATKRAATIKLEEQTRPQHAPPDLWLLFAPVKKSRTDFIVEKATELGAARIAPVFTRYTNSERVRMDRMEALAREAAEQTERLDLPDIAEARTLDQALDGWDAARPLIYCDEGGEVPPMLKALGGLETGKLAVLIGPEGGFSEDERARLKSLDFVRPVSLGPRILRADTAAAAALALIQSAWGDWD